MGIDVPTLRFGIGGAGTWFVGNAPAALLEIRGKTNELQLAVQGGPGQTANLTEWRNSGSTAISVVTNTGGFGIGTTSLTTSYSTNNKLLVNGGSTFTPSSGSERVTINPQANLSAGYTSFLIINPSTLALTGGEALSKIHIQNGSSSIPALWIVNEGTGDLLSLGRQNTYANSLFVVKNNGYVGIGTTSPSDLVQTVKNGCTLFSVGNNALLSGLDNNTGSGSAGSVTITGGSDAAGSGAGAGSLSLTAGAWGLTDRARIVLNSVGTGGTGGGITISAGTNSAGIINVGRRAGNGQPAGVVNISGGAGDANGNGGTVTLSGGTGTGDISYKGGNVVLYGGNGILPSPAGNVIFGIGGTEYARLNNNGNFGIGTTTPTTELEVNGDLKVSGIIIAPGTIVQTIVSTSETTSSLNVTNYTEASSDYRISFTPKLDNSIIMVEFIFPINTAMASNTVFDMQIIRDIGGTEVPVGVGPVNGTRRQVSYVGRPGNGTDGNDRNQVYMIAKDNGLTAGTTYTYGFKYRRETGGSGTCYFNASNLDSNVYGFSGVMTIRVTEIAQ
jgi:hypothetical protein